MSFSSRMAHAESRTEGGTQWLELDSVIPQLDFGDAVREGLSAASKWLPSQFFYDEEGSRLFEAICELPEYYLTRAEAEILEQRSPDLADRMTGIHTLVELGSGSAVKTEYLLRAFEDDGRPLRYLPIDVSEAALIESVERLEALHPQLEIRPAIAEYEAGLHEISTLDLGPMLIMWLGSSIGNLDRESAATFLSRLGDDMQPADRLLVGIDLRKQRDVLERAYDDSQGVTAAFDLNLLNRINRELGGRFDLDQFVHRVHYDEATGSVKSFLESQLDQTIRIDALDLEIGFTQGERIHTEDSHKYSLDEIDELADQAGLVREQAYFDQGRRFSLNLFRASA